MLRSFCSHLAVALPAFCLISAYPIQDLDSRQGVDCTDPQAVFIAACWNQLNLTSYLTAPGTGWITRTPTCPGGTTGSGVACCITGEPWSTCFLRLGRGFSGADCSTINSQACVNVDNVGNEPSSLVPFVGLAHIHP